MRKPRDPTKEPLSPAQVRFLNENAPTFMIWLEATGDPIGMNLQPWQKRIVEALMRKDVLTPDGRITESGKKAWERARHKIQGRRASLVIMDDPETIA
jgi:hypothetical protein